MQLGELLLQGFIVLISAYLAATNALADRVFVHLERFGLYDSLPVTELEEAPSDSVALPSRPIPVSFARLLLDNIEYQEAALLGAASSRDTTGSSIEEALVNILCTYRREDEVRTTTGSGAFVDDKGIILTNAHVAQFLLLAHSDEGAECIIRQGSPAKDRYKAELLYLSPLWMGANAAEIDADVPSGTGEYDYALLYVTEVISGDLPERFPALAIDTKERDTAELRDLRAAGYPGGDFDTEGPDAELTSEVSETALVRRFTFGSGSSDLIAMSGSKVGEYGSSGGPVLDEDGDMIGLIVTRGNPERDGARSLRALTLSYVDTAIEEEAGFDLETMLSGDIPHRARIFKEALAPALTQMLAQDFE